MKKGRNPNKLETIVVIALYSASAEDMEIIACFFLLFPWYKRAAKKNARANNKPSWTTASSQ